MSRWEGESHEDVVECFGMGVTAWGVICGVVEWVKCGTLRYFGHVTRMNGDDSVSI